MSECIISRHAKNACGYGSMTYRGKTRLAHRVAYCESKGIDIDSINGRVVMHTCDNPPCINPDHLVLGTINDNVQDCLRKGRARKASRQQNGNCKLTEEQVSEIRKTYVKNSRTHGSNALGKKFNTSSSNIIGIVKFKNWID